MRIVVIRRLNGREKRWGRVNVLLDQSFAYRILPYANSSIAENKVGYKSEHNPRLSCIVCLDRRRTTIPERENALKNALTTPLPVPLGQQNELATYHSLLVNTFLDLRRLEALLPGWRIHSHSSLEAAFRQTKPCMPLVTHPCFALTVYR